MKLLPYAVIVVLDHERQCVVVLLVFLAALALAVPVLRIQNKICRN